MFRDLAENPGDETFPGVAVVRLDGGLFFATADALEERIRALVRNGDEPVHAVVLDLEGVDFVDSQGAAKLAEILDFAESSEVDLGSPASSPSVATVLEKRRRARPPRPRPHPRQRPPGRRGTTESRSDRQAGIAPVSVVAMSCSPLGAGVALD